MNTRDPGPDSPADAYGRVLAGAGGREIDRRDSLAQGAVTVALYESPHYDLVVPGLAMTRLSVNLMASPVLGALDGARPRAFSGARHTVFMTPSQAEAKWSKPRPSRHVNLYFRADCCDDPLLPRAAWDNPLFDQRIAPVGRLAEALARELTKPGALAEMAIDALARLLLVEVARRGNAREPAAALSPRVLMRIDEFMRAHLSDRLLVRDLAAVAGLSPSHFAHAYTRATGQSPHRRLLALRVQRAGQLLTTTPRPLVDVAAECGFATQQHMTLVLRQHCGLTPGRLRAGDRCNGTDPPRD